MAAPPLAMQFGLSGGGIEVPPLQGRLRLKLVVGLAVPARPPVCLASRRVVSGAAIVAPGIRGVVGR